LLRVRSSRRDLQGAACSGHAHSRGDVPAPGANASRYRCVCVPQRMKNGHHVPLVRLTSSNQHRACPCRRLRVCAADFWPIAVARFAAAFR
jgi:hypothetical protein